MRDAVRSEEQLGNCKKGFLPLWGQKYFLFLFFIILTLRNEECNLLSLGGRGNIRPCWEAQELRELVFLG